MKMTFESILEAITEWKWKREWWKGGNGDAAVLTTSGTSDSTFPHPVVDLSESLETGSDDGLNFDSCMQ